MTRLRSASTSIILLLLSVPVWAQVPAEQAGDRLTLQQAIDRGLAASHRLGELEAREASAAAVVGSAKAARQPQASVQAGYTRTNHVDAFGIPGLASPGQPLLIIYPDVPDNWRTRLDLQWPIYSFGRTDALERAARAENQASGLDLTAARNDLRLEITRAYWAVVTAGESVNVLTESLRRMDATLEDVRNRLNVGIVPPNDVTSVEAQRSRQQLLLIQARNLHQQTLADLCRLTGVPLTTPLVLDERLEAAVAPPAPSPQLVDDARRARPDRQALEARIATASERRTAAVAGKWPIVSVGGGIDFARPNPKIFPRVDEWKESWDANINFTWTFWDGGRVGSDVAQQTAAERAARERLAEFDTLLEVEVLQRRLDVDAARAAITTANDGVLAAAEARRVVGDRFTAGVATTTEVLDAQVALLQAQLDLTQSLANERLAEARLARAVGR